MFNPYVYLADTSAMLDLAHAGTRLKSLTKLVNQGRLRLPAPVAAELKGKVDAMRTWINRHQRQCVIQTTNDHVQELRRISTQYRDYLKVSNADPLVVCMGLYYQRANQGTWLVLTSDGGIQATCIMEQIRFIPTNAFRRLEHI